MVAHMGIQLQSTKCDSCGQVISEAAGPNWAIVDGPPGGTTVVYTCMNGRCGKVLGVVFVASARD
jgi:hypothetical protein